MKSLVVELQIIVQKFKINSIRKDIWAIVIWPKNKNFGLDHY